MEDTKSIEEGRGPLTLSSLVHRIQARRFAFLRQADQGQQHVELVPVQGYLLPGTPRRNNGHDLCLGIGAEFCSGQCPRDSAGGDATAPAMLANNGVKGLNVALGHFGGREQVADQLGAGLLLAGRRHVPGRV